VTGFRVWARYAERVDLVTERGAEAMRADGGGWFVLERDAAHGERYRYALDGGTPRPDPRSPWQPDGVHGASAVVDHGRFAWSDDGFAGPALADSIIYELHIGTFSPEGTFAGAAEQLDHLVDLGITTVELMPVVEFPGTRGWGYDGVDLYAPHHAYGGPDGLKAFVDACHGRGLAVVLDVVYNHLGPDGNYLAEFGPYFTDRYTTPWGQAMNLDGQGSDNVRDFIVENACMWLRDYHFDGLRLDAVHALLDTSAVHVLEQLSSRVDALAAEVGRPLFAVAESDLNDPRLVWPRDQHGYGMHGAWSDDFHHALHAALTGERAGYYADFGDLSQVADALKYGYVFRGQYSGFRERHYGRSPEGVEGWRFVGAAQNHDQVGNRAAGERLTALISEPRLRAAAALVLTSAFVPMLFQGEEWAASSPFLYFTDHTNQKLGRAVSDGRRREFAAFGWAPEDVPDPQAEPTFLRSKLDWSERAREPHATMLAWYRHLTDLRRNTPALRDGRFDLVQTKVDDAARSLVVERGSVRVAVNLDPDEVFVEADGG
jgi:maltooligosyltrehalose trehalohydrolase